MLLFAQKWLIINWKELIIKCTPKQTQQVHINSNLHLHCLALYTIEADDKKLELNYYRLFIMHQSKLGLPCKQIFAIKYFHINVPKKYLLVVISIFCYFLKKMHNLIQHISQSFCCFLFSISEGQSYQPVGFLSKVSSRNL